jgi:hypothetical protein
MKTKKRATGYWMVAGLFAMGMMAQSVWGQEGETAKQEKVSKQRPVNVELKVSLVLFPKELIEALARKPGSPSETDLIKAWRDGKGRLVASHLMLGKAGQPVAARGVLEHIYPSEFNLRAGEVPKTTKGAKETEKGVMPYVGKIIPSVDTQKDAGSATGAFWAVEPQNLTMREIGFLTTVALESCAAPSQFIQVKPELEYVVRENDHEISTVQTSTNAPPIKIVQPEFHSMQMKVSRECSDGRTVVQGGMVSNDGKETGYFFITPRLGSVSKKAPTSNDGHEMRQFEMQQLLVNFPRTVIEAMAKGEDTAAPSETQIIKAWQEGKGRLVASDLSVSLPGKEVIVKGVSEHSYPSEYNMVGLILRNGDLVWGGEPQNFVMREIGFLSQFVLSINDDLGVIDMILKSGFVSRCADHKIDIALSTGGKLQKVTQPEVYNQSIEICGGIQSGQTVVAGGMLSADGQEMGYFLITPKIAKSQK